MFLFKCFRGKNFYSIFLAVILSWQPFWISGVPRKLDFKIKQVTLYIYMSLDWVKFSNFQTYDWVMNIKLTVNTPKNVVVWIFKLHYMVYTLYINESNFYKSKQLLYCQDKFFYNLNYVII